MRYLPPAGKIKKTERTKSYGDLEQKDFVLTDGQHVNGGKQALPTKFKHV